MLDCVQYTSIPHTLLDSYVQYTNKVFALVFIYIIMYQEHIMKEVRVGGKERDTPMH